MELIYSKVTENKRWYWSKEDIWRVMGTTILARLDENSTVVFILIFFAEYSNSFYSQMNLILSSILINEAAKLVLPRREYRNL